MKRLHALWSAVTDPSYTLLTFMWARQRRRAHEEYFRRLDRTFERSNRSAQ